MPAVQATSPLLLLFIGIKIERTHYAALLAVNMNVFRSGLSFTSTALIAYFAPHVGWQLDQHAILGWTIYLQSACSFWPYATMSSVKQTGKGSTGTCLWDPELAMAILTTSFPVSILVLSIISVVGGCVNAIGTVGLAMMITSSICMKMATGRTLDLTSSSSPSLASSQSLLI